MAVAQKVAVVKRLSLVEVTLYWIWKPIFACIADLQRPLMGTVQERQGVIPLPADRPSQAIVDVSENMRAKIYSMFCKLGR